MGAGSQTLLLFSKNFLLRFRYPGLFGLEVLWPILIVGIVAIMRLGVPPERKPTCYYSPRAMPSAGAVPFLQTYICNLDNRCFTNEMHLAIAEEASSSFSRMSNELAPYLSSNDVMDALSVSNKSVGLIDTFNNIVSDEGLIDGLERAMYIGTYFKDPDKVKNILETKFNFPPNVSTALMESKLNVVELLNLTGTPNFREIACNPSQLKRYLTFPEEVNITDVSLALCSIDDVEGLSNEVVTQLNVTKLVEMLSLFERIKTNVGLDSMETIFNNIADMLELLFQSESILQTIGKIAAIPDIADIIRKIPEWIVGLDDLRAGLSSAKSIVSSLEPMIKGLGMEGETLWMAANNAVHFGDNIASLSNGQWNGTAEEFVQPLRDLIKNIEDLAQTPLGQQTAEVLNFLTKINWPDVYNQIIYTATIDQRTIEYILNSFQEMMEKMPTYDTMKMMIRLVDHSLDILTIFTNKTIDLRQALKHLLDSQNSMRSTLDSLVPYGPEVIKLVLQAFTRPALLGELMANASSYGGVCRRVMAELQPGLPANVYQNLHDVLCAESMEQEMTALLTNLKLNELSDVVNSTAQEIMALYKGDFYAKYVSVLDLYHKYVRFTVVFNEYIYGDKWMEIFKMFNFDFNVNQEGWDQVTDMLSTDFLTNLVLSSYRGLGTALVGTRVSDSIAPAIHMMSKMVKSIYEQLQMMSGTDSNNPMMDLMRMATTYFPEIVQYTLDMWNNNMDAIYTLAESADPLDTFCKGNYLNMAQWPANAPVNEMTQLICTTNWTIAFQQLNEPSMNMQKTIEEMLQIFEDPAPVTYDIEMDWIDMMDYMERIIDMVDTQFMENLDFSMGYQTILNNMNFTTVGEGVDLLFAKLDTMTMQDLDKMVELLFRVLENLNKSQADAGWYSFKSGVWVFEAWLDITANMTKQQADSSSLRELLSSYPPELLQINVLLARAYPEAVLAIRTLLLNPEKALDELIAQGIHLPDCQTHFASDLLVLPPTSAVHELERYLCGMDWAKFAEEISPYTQSSSPFMGRINYLTQTGMTNVPINWRELEKKVADFVESFSAPMNFENFDLNPYNVTAISLTWQQFYKAVETLQNFDMNRIQPIAMKIQQLFSSLDSSMGGMMNSIGLGNTTDMLNFFNYGNSYVNYHLMKLLNKELAYFNSTQKVIVFEYLGVDKSPELARIRDFLVSSPEINAVGMATLERLITQPDRVVVNTDFDKLCSDINEFTKVFVVDAALNPAAIQKSVCGLNINFTILLDDFMRNKESVAEFVHAMEKMSQVTSPDELKVDVAALAEEIQKYSALIEAVIVNPPEISSTRDIRWMNMDEYSQQWDRMGNALNTFGQDLSNSSYLLEWESQMSKLVFQTMDNVFGLKDIFGTISVILDLVKYQVDQQTGNSIEAIRQYPNGRIVIDLISYSQEAVQTFLYTVLTQQQKVARWSTALQSGEQFCQTPPDTLFSVPPEVNFNISSFIEKACSLNVEEFLREMQDYQGISDLETALNNTTPVNATTLSKKLDEIVKVIVTSSGMQGDDSLNKIFDPAEWDKIGARIGTWFNQSMDLSPENIPTIIMDLVSSVFGSVGEDFQELFNKATALTDVVLDEMLIAANSTSLKEAFKDMPSFQQFVDLLNELPELFETFLYTNTYDNVKMTTALTPVKSWSEFCALKALDIFTLAPNSTWDAQAWMSKLCSIDMNGLAEEIERSATGRKINEILNGTKTDPVDLTGILEKANHILKKIESGSGLQERVFDPKIWETFEANTKNWIWPYNSIEEYLSAQGKVMLHSMINTLESVDGADEVLVYIDAVLDMLMAFKENLDGNSAEMQMKYPTLSSVFDLLENAPEMVETVLYTVLTQPTKTAKWGEALMSFEAFCATPADTIMSVPPGSQFDVAGYLSKVCSIDLDKLNIENLEYNGLDQLMDLFTSNDTSSVNTTALLAKFDKVAEALTSIDVNALSNMRGSRAFNMTIWDQVITRVGQFASANMPAEITPTSVVAIIADTMDAALSQLPMIQEPYNQALALTTVLVDQAVKALNASSVKDVLDMGANMQKMLEILDYLPEIYETLLYSVSVHSEKIRANSDALSDIVSFCTTRPETIFTVPPQSDFNLTAVVVKLCTVNMTELEQELMSFQTSQDIANILNGTSNIKPDMRSLLSKLDTLLQRIDKNPVMTDRFLNETVWSRINNRVDQWMTNLTSINTALISPRTAFMVINQALTSDPSLKETLRPVMASAAVLDQILNLVIRLENMTRFGTGELFANWEEMQKILDWIQTEGTIELFMDAKSSQKLTALLMNENAIADFCQPGTPATKYLSEPASGKVDLSLFQQKFCSLDFEKMGEQFLTFFNVDYIAKVANGSADFDIEQLQRTFDHFNNLVAKWEKSPPTFDLPERWMNETFWTQLLENQVAEMDPGTVQDQILDILRGLQPLSEMDGFKEAIIVLNTVLDLVNENMLAMQNGQYTLGNAADKIPALQQLLGGLSLNKNTLEALLLAPITNTSLFAQMFTSEDFQKEFCVDLKWHEILKLPLGFDVTPLNTAICNGYAQPLLNNLRDAFSLSSMISALENINGTDSKKQWEMMMDKVQKMMTNLDTLMQNPPTFSTDVMLQNLIDRYTNETDLWSMMSALNTLQAAMGNDTGLSSPVESILAVGNVIVDYLNGMLARAQLQNGRLDLAGLFEGAPDFVKIVSSVLDIEPDPVSGLFSATMRLEKAEEFSRSVTNSSYLKELFCDPQKFSEIFVLQHSVNITSVLSVLCQVNFEDVAAQLESSFMISGLERDMDNAWANPGRFNPEVFTSKIEKIISQIEQLTTADYVMFGKHDMGDLVRINTTLLLDGLMAQFPDLGDTLSVEYITAVVKLFSDVLNSMGPSEDFSSSLVALRFIRVYMQNLNTFLRSVSDKPISLAVLMNNTQVGNILIPILNDPHLLDGLVDAEINVKELAKLLQSPDPMSALCGDELWNAIQVPDSEKQTIVKLRDKVCEVNSTLLLWQTVMVSANGYQLKQQMDIIAREVSFGQGSTNAMALSKEVMDFVELMRVIIDQYSTGNRSLDSLMDLRGFQELMNRAQSQIAQKLMDQAANWSVDLAEILLPNLVDQSTYTTMAKLLNSMNLMMNATIEHLQAVADGELSLSTLLNNADDLVSQVEAMIRVAQNIGSAFANNEFEEDKIVAIFSDLLNNGSSKCRNLDAFAKEMTNQATPSDTVKDLATVICAFVDGSIDANVQKFVDYGALEQKLTQLWNAYTVTPEYRQFASNIQTISALVEQLANKTLIISSDLQNNFDLSSMLRNLQNLTSDPALMFRSFRLVGLIMDAFLPKSDEMTAFFSAMNSYAIMPLVNVLEALKANHLSLDNIASDPSTLLTVMSTLLDFDTHFGVIETVLIQQQVWALENYYGGAFQFCSNGTVDQKLIDYLNLPLNEEEITHMFCEMKPSEWKDYMKGKGASSVQIMLFFNKVFDARSLGSGNYYDKNIGWVDLMTNLEKLTTLLTEKKIDPSDIEQAKTAWETVKDVVFEKTFNSALSYLQLLESLSEPTQSKDWEAFRQFLKFSTTAFDFFNSHLQRLGTGQYVKLEDVLPDAGKLSELITQLFGPSNAAELLATTVNSDMFYTLTLEDRWNEVCVNSTMMSMVFRFPEGTDVNLVTKHLCQAIANKSTAFDELVSLFGAGDMLKELDNFLNQKYSPDLWNSTVYSMVHPALMRLIHTAEGLQSVSLDSTSTQRWVDTILAALDSLNTRSNPEYLQMCNRMIMYLNGTQGYQMAHDMLSQSMTVMKMAAEFIKVLPELDDLGCILEGGDSIDLYGFMDKLIDLGALESLEKALKAIVSPPKALDCSAPIELSQAIMDFVNQSMYNQGLNLERLGQCVGKTEEQLGKIISDVSRALDLIKDLLTIMQMPEVTGLFSDPAVLDTVELLFDLIRMNENGILAFADLLQDPANVENYLINGLGMSNETVFALVNATVNSNWAYVLTKPLDEIVDILCNEERLAKVIKLPVNSPVNITDLTQLLCTSEVKETAAILKNASLGLDQVSQKMNNGTENIGRIISNMVDEIADAIVLLGDNIDLINMLLNDLSLEKIKENVEELDAFLRNDVLRSLVNSIRSLLKGVEELLPEGMGKTIVRDIQKFVDGLMGLDQFKNLMMDSVKVQDLVKDPDYLKFYMVKQLGFTETMAQEILNGSFSVALFMETDLPDRKCDEVVEKLIILNSTAATLDDIRSALCSLTTDQYKELMTALTPELDIGKFVARYVKYMEESVLGTTNMTKQELSDVIETLDKGQAVLARANEIIYNSAKGPELLDLFSPESSAQLSLESLTPTICAGTPVDIFDTDFDPGVLVTTKEDIEDEIDKGIVDEQPDLPNEFCVSMYESIRKSGIGSILWAYLKPIIRGKIVFTPVNPTTEAIMKRANSFFSIVEEVNHYATIWAKESPNLLAMADAASQAQELKDALKNEFVKGLLEATTGIPAKTLISSLDALEANNTDMNQIKGLQVAAELVANYTSCIETDRFIGVADEEALLNVSYHLSKRKLFLAGIVFDEVLEDTSSGTRRRRQAGSPEDEVAKHVTYKIRMDVDNTMDTNSLKSRLWKMEAEDNFVEDMRYLRGFIHIQDMIDRAIIDIHKNEIYETPGFRIKQMPFPCHHDDNFVFLLGSYLIPIMMTFVFLASLGIATHNFVYDRENGQEQTLRVMGLLSGLNFIAWVLSTMLIMAVVCIILAVMIKYTEIFINSNLFIVFLLLLTFCFSSLMQAYMVSAFFNSTTMAILFVLMIYLMSYLPFILVVSLQISMNFWQKTLACLASTTAFSFASMSMAYLEEAGAGLQWYNIQEEVTTDFSVHWCCIMMLIDAAIYFVIGWYVRGVRPGKYGVSQPWYFPILPSYWCSCLSSAKPSIEPDFTPVAPPASGLFEGPPDGLRVGIAAENLSKIYSKGCFGKTQVVHNLSLNFYEGHVTSLLGHNGAAKTTTINMICGVLEPTKGRVLMNGQNPVCCKGNLGVCPQQNALFSYMTALQHMLFYAGVKGANVLSPEVKREVSKLLQDVDMYQYRNKPVSDMSYGMKRRLCVALAFVGGSKIVILDEPTSGIDPNARKNIWNLITRNRPGRTILLSTHHLDEADILSDRIAIMHQGKLLCCGRPAFLKKTLGGDFRLTVAKKEPVYDNSGSVSQETLEMRNRSSNAAILDYIQSMSPSATMREQIGHDLSINLPREPERMKVSFHQFFNSLDRFSEQLGIQGYGVSDITLEEVFLDLTSKADASSDPGVVNPVMTSLDRTTALDIDPNLTQPKRQSQSLAPPQLDTDEKTFYSPGSRISYPPFGDNKRGPLFVGNAQFSGSNRKAGFSLSMAQTMALFIKRFHHYRRNWRVLLTCILLPLVTFLIALGFTSVRPDENDMKSLVLDPTIYGSDVYNFFKDSYFNTRYTNALVDSDVGIGTSCMADTDKDLFQGHTCVADSNWYNRTQLFEMAYCKNARQAYINMYSDFTIDEKVTVNNQKLQNLANQDIAGYILRTFDKYKETRYGGWSFEKSRDNTQNEMEPYAWFSSKGYHAMPSYFNGLSNAVLRAQLPNGQNPDEYGITTINHPIRFGTPALSVKTLQTDAADAGIAIMVVMAFSFIPGGFILYLINERVQKEKQLQNISGVGLLAYWIVALIWDMLIYMVAVAIAVALVAIFETDSFYLKDNHSAFAVMLILYGWSIIPLLYCMVRLFDKPSTAYLVTFCMNLFLAMATVISLLVMQLFRSETGAARAYKVCKYLYMIFPQYNLGQGLMDMVSTVFKYKLFQRFGEEIYDDPYSFDVAGYYMLAMGIEGFVFFIFAIILDVMSSPSVKLSNHAKPMSPDEDIDVIRERERILQESNNDVLVVDDLSKVHRRGRQHLRAVDHISFGVAEGESFGLLGVNGAGKTTTFRMLTGDLKPAGGRASLNGVELKYNDRKLGQDVGYCPQEGGLDQYLTGEENLYFHARLRGFSGKEMKEIVSELLRCLQLQPFAHRTVSKYSGGTKRKLALAVALLGDPPIVYLDEPTTGMDPATRRLAWACILRANKNGQSVVLTSHSMDECDALCSRIAIMVNGRIKCIGSPQDLKNKFGDGYIVVMHAAKDFNQDIVTTFLNKFPGSVIKAKHNQCYELGVPGASARVADIIALLQAAEREGAIEYYSLSQATLDSVFVSFAQEQRDVLDSSDYYSGSSSGNKSESPSGSISSSGTPSSGAGASTGKNAANFVNPAFIQSDEEAPEVTFGPPPYRNNYQTNLTIGSDKPAVKPEDVTDTKL